MSHVHWAPAVPGQCMYWQFAAHFYSMTLKTQKYFDCSRVPNRRMWVFSGDGQTHLSDAGGSKTLNPATRPRGLRHGALLHRDFPSDPSDPSGYSKNVIDIRGGGVGLTRVPSSLASFYWDVMEM